MWILALWGCSGALLLDDERVRTPLDDTGFRNDTGFRPPPRPGPTPLPPPVPGPGCEPMAFVSLLDGDGVADSAGSVDADAYFIDVLCIDGLDSFGFAQTSVGAAGWYGEDCLSGDFCHPFQGFLALNRVGVISDIQPGQTTLMNVDFPTDTTPPLTYVVWAGATCYTWGDDPSYYAGCTQIVGIQQ